MMKTEVYQPTVLHRTVRDTSHTLGDCLVTRQDQYVTRIGVIDTAGRILTLDTFGNDDATKNETDEKHKNEKNKTQEILVNDNKERGIKGLKYLLSQDYCSCEDNSKVKTGKKNYEDEYRSIRLSRRRILAGIKEIISDQGMFKSENYPTLLSVTPLEKEKYIPHPIHSLTAQDVEQAVVDEGHDDLITSDEEADIIFFIICVTLVILLLTSVTCILFFILTTNTIKF